MPVPAPVEAAECRRDGSDAVAQRVRDIECAVECQGQAGRADHQRVRVGTLLEAAADDRARQLQRSGAVQRAKSWQAYK